MFQNDMNIQNEIKHMPYFRIAKLQSYSDFKEANLLQVDNQCMNVLITIYTGCLQWKQNAWFSLLWYSKIEYILILSDRTLSSEKSDTKITEIGWVVLVL